jgi:DHA1 family tetracycline resistance protein-like MFS transporter
MKNSKNAAIGFIFVTMTIDVIGLGLIIPVMPALISEVKKITIEEASEWGGYLMFAYAAMQFLFSPLIGNLSDRFGRKKVILTSLVGFAIDYVILAIAPNYSWLLIGRLLAGVTGASFTASTAYISDISTRENRARNFGLIGAAFGLGFIIGPALGGLLSVWGIRAPFWAAAGFCLLNFLYGYFVLPESLKPENRRAFEWKKANPVGALMHFKKYPAITGLIVSFFFIYLASQSVYSIWNYYTMSKFSWTEKQVGLSLALMGLLVGSVQGGLTRVVNRRLGNEKSAYLGLLLYTIGLVLFAFATSGWMMYAFLVPYCLGGIAGPALQSIITSHVAQNEQGQLQGGLTSLMSLTAIIGPLIMTKLFAVSTHPDAPVHFPGAPFLLGAILMFISTFISFLALRRDPVLSR